MISYSIMKQNFSEGQWIIKRNISSYENDEHTFTTLKEKFLEDTLSDVFHKNNPINQVPSTNMSNNQYANVYLVLIT